MNPKHLLNMAEEAMIRAKSDSAFRWVIIVRHGKIKCVPRKSRLASETMIMELTQDQVKHGLTSDGWDTLSHSLAKYWKEQKL